MTSLYKPPSFLTYKDHLLKKNFFPFIQRGYSFPKLFREMLNENQDKELIDIFDNEVTVFLELTKGKVFEMIKTDDYALAREFKDWVFLNAVKDFELEVVAKLLDKDLYCPLPRFLNEMKIDFPSGCVNSTNATCIEENLIALSCLLLLSGKYAEDDLIFLNHVYDNTDDEKLLRTKIIERKTTLENKMFLSRLNRYATYTVLLSSVFLFFILI